METGEYQGENRRRLVEIQDRFPVSGPVISSGIRGTVPPLVLRFISEQGKRTPTEWGCSDMNRIPSSGTVPRIPDEITGPLTGNLS